MVFPNVRFLLGLLMVSLLGLCALPIESHARPIHSSAIWVNDIQNRFAASAQYDLHRATVAIKAGDCAEAVKHLDKAIEKSPTNIIALYNQGSCYLDMAKASRHAGEKARLLDRSESAFIRVQSLNHSLVVTYFKLGKIALMQSDWEKAKRYYQTGLRYEPDSAILLFNLAGVYDEAKNYPEAIKYYQKAIDQEPNFIYAYNNLGLIFEQTKDLDRAEIVYKKALEINPDYNFARLNLGNLYAERKDFGQAKKMYQKSLAVDPDNPWAHLYLGNVYFQQGKLAEAAKAYRLSIERNPNYATTYYLHAVTLNRLERFDEALISSLKYVALSPQGPYAKQVMSLILSLKVRQAEAIGK